MQLMEYEDSLKVGEIQPFIFVPGDNEHLPNGCLILSIFHLVQRDDLNEAYRRIQALG